MWRIAAVVGVGMLLGCAVRHGRPAKTVEAVATPTTTQPSAYAAEKRPKVVVLCSRGGYTHVSLARVVRELIGHRYDVEVVYVFDEVPPRVTPTLARLAGAAESGDALYNRLLRQDKRKTLNFVSEYLTRSYFRRHRRRVAQVIGESIEQARTEMLISLVPFVNGAAMMAARQRGIPLLVVSVDSSLRMWLPDMTRPAYKRAAMLLAYDLPAMHKALDRAGWPAAARHYAGLPPRAEFFHPLPKEQAKQRLGISPDRFTLMVMMGGSGSSASVRYVRELAQAGFSGHVIVAAGRNERLLKELARVRLPPSLSATYVGFTNQIAEYLSAADVLLTKPGPTTFHEAIQLGLPLLIENTGTLLEWEAPTVNFVQQQGLGMVLKKVSKLPVVLAQLRDDAAIRTRLRANVWRYREQLPGFRRTLCQAVGGLLNVEDEEILHHCRAQAYLAASDE
ncbi:MAG: glycosyltransferase [Myxococcota bacterium]